MYIASVGFVKWKFIVKSNIVLMLQFGGGCGHNMSKTRKNVSSDI